MSSPPDGVTVTLGEQSVTARLADGKLLVKTPVRSVALTISITNAGGWTTPTRALQPPVTHADRTSATAKVTYPVADHRELTIELSATADVPAVFVSSRLERSGSPAGDYYYWSSDVSFQRYLAPDEVTIDPKVWTTLPARDWLFLPMEAGAGLAVLPTNVSGRGPTEGGTLFLHALPRSLTTEPGSPLCASFGLAGVSSVAAAAELAARAHQHHLPAVPPPTPPRGGFGPAAPAWLRGAEIYNLYYRPAAQWTDQVVNDRLRGFPFIVGSTPDKAALDRCHRAGVRLLHYVCYTCLLDTALQVKEGGTVYSEWTESLDHETRDLKDHPDWICIDEKGAPKHDAWGMAHGHKGLLNTCLHQPGLHEAAVRQVRKLMELGYDGVFIDLAGPTVECSGDKFGRHQHADGGTNTDAYERLLGEIHQAVKSYGRGRVVIQNTCTAILSRHWAQCDMQMLEAVPFGDGSTGLGAGVPELAWSGTQLAPAVAAGKVPVILSYLGSLPKMRLRELTLYSVAYARLYDCLWADSFTLLDRPDGAELAHELYALRLGRPRGPVVASGGASYRLFEHGLVALNSTKAAVSLSVPVPRAGATDVGYGRTLPAANGQVTLELAAEAGRVLRW